MGLDRLVALLIDLDENSQYDKQLHVYIARLGEKAEIKGLLLAEDLRNKLPGLKILTHCGTGNFKKQLKRADKSGAKICVLIGDDELLNNKVTIKFLRERQEQIQLSISDLADWLNENIQR